MQSYVRFWAKVERAGPNDCWIWRANLSKGYGRVRLGGRDQMAHRVAYEALVGPIPEGLTLDHLCRNRACVNPAHLEPVTMIENVMRGESPAAQNSRKTTCDHGHPFDRVDARGFRVCETCRETRRLRAREAAWDAWAEVANYP